jgi:hypothetical protein
MIEGVGIMLKLIGKCIIIILAAFILDSLIWGNLPGHMLMDGVTIDSMIILSITVGIIGGKALKV